MDIGSELRRMAADSTYCAENYARIYSFEGELVPLVANPAQVRLRRLMDLHDKGMIVKGRKMGSSTEVAWDYFHETQFTPGLKTLVAAHRKESAEEIFRIYKTFAKNMPDFVKGVEGLGVLNVSKDAIEFEHGGRIVCVSADSEAARGSTSQRVHLSEFCWYRDIERTMGSIMGSVPASAKVWRESTANGLNHGYRLWHQEDGYYKLFLAWMMDPRYTSRTKPKGGIPEEWKRYGKEHGLTKQQLWWAVRTWRERFGANTRLFHQEFPATAELAFQTSGDRVFSLSFPQWRITKENVYKYTGIRRYDEARPYGLYICGVDAASGSANGDYTAWYIVEVSDPKKPRVVSTFYGKSTVHEFAPLLLEELQRYGALAVVESNQGYGVAILEYLVDHGYAMFYRRKTFDKIQRKWTEKLGFNTNKTTRDLLVSKLHSMIEGGDHEVIDPRLGSELNTFVSVDGKWQAAEGEHDDMIMAAGMAMMGIEQVGKLEEQVLMRRPSGLREILEWELRTGKLYREHQHEFADSAVDELMWM